MSDPTPRMVQCVKLGRLAPVIERPPFPGELGLRIYEHVSAEGYIGAADDDPDQSLWTQPGRSARPEPSCASRWRTSSSVPAPRCLRAGSRRTRKCRHGHGRNELRVAGSGFLSFLVSVSRSLLRDSAPHSSTSRLPSHHHQAHHRAEIVIRRRVCASRIAASTEAGRRRGRR